MNLLQHLKKKKRNRQWNVCWDELICSRLCKHLLMITSSFRPRCPYISQTLYPSDWNMNPLAREQKPQRKQDRSRHLSNVDNICSVLNSVLRLFWICCPNSHYTSHMWYAGPCAMCGSLFISFLFCFVLLSGWRIQSGGKVKLKQSPPQQQMDRGTLLNEFSVQSPVFHWTT